MVRRQDLVGLLGRYISRPTRVCFRAMPRVLLVRHAHAIDDRAGLEDEARYLTSKGRRVTREVAAKLAELGLVPTRILTSPLVRAVQTAEILATIEAFEGPVEVHPPLTPGNPVALALAPLEDAGQHDLVFLVGHEPAMRAYAAHLLGVRRFPSFKKAGACLVRLRADGAGSFEWMLVPKTLELVESIDEIEA